MVIEKVPLFSDRREILLASFLWIFLLLIHLFWLHQRYQHFIDPPFYYTHGIVLQSFPKGSGNGAYRILKIRSDDGLTFYTKSYRPEELSGKRVRLQLFPERVGFLEYLKGPYLPSRIKGVNEEEGRLLPLLQRLVERQHSRADAAAFYNAIFFALPLDRDLRQKIAALGASHLVALSGFHLGILWGGVFLLLSPLYRLFQSRYFPWRYSLLDIGALSLLLLAGYLWLTGPPPSLLRSYAMLALGWSALLLGIELLSFTFLAVVTALLLLLDPRLALSLGFWLSVAGVFYIYLLLRYWGEGSKWLFALLVMPVGIYLAMLPIVHGIFPAVSPWQWLSPLLSLLFTLFYPLTLFLHLFGLGGLFDNGLLWLWNLPGPAETKTLPLWYSLLYLTLSLAAIRYRWAFVGVGAMSLGAAGWLYL